MASVDLGIQGVESEQTVAIGIDTGKMLEDQRSVNEKTKMTWATRKEAWAERNKNMGLKDPRLRMDDRVLGNVDRRLPAIWCSKGCHYVQNCRIFGGNGQETRLEDIKDETASIAEATRLGLPMTPEFWRTHRQEVAEMLVTYVAIAKEKSDTLCQYCYQETSTKDDHTTHMVSKHLDRYMMDHGLSPNPPPAVSMNVPSFVSVTNPPPVSTFTVVNPPAPPLAEEVKPAHPSAYPVKLPGLEGTAYNRRGPNKLDRTATLCTECGREFKGPAAFARHMTGVAKRGGKH